MHKELTFLLALWKANLLAAMEYRIPFLTQVIGMILNNGAYFLFWVLFFDRFEDVQGWGLTDMLILFGVVALAFGLAVFFFGNILTLADVIATGRLDYYLALPRPVLLHALASRSVASGAGDAIYGLMSFIAAGYYDGGTIIRLLVATLLATITFLSFLVLVQSSAFWLGNATLLSRQMTNAMVTFALYPITLFDGTAKLILFTAIPAAFVGAVPAEFVRTFSWGQLGLMLLGAGIFLGLAIIAFHTGLRRYESGSAIQIQV